VPQQGIKKSRVPLFLFSQWDEEASSVWLSVLPFPNRKTDQERLMARIERNTVSYFPHDSHASYGDTLTILQSQFGNNGYAVWFKLLEKLAATDGHFMDCNNKIKWRLFLAQLGVDEITTVDILKLLVEMDAIDKDLWQSRVIWCQHLVDNLADVYRNRRRELPQKPVITSDNPITTPINSITTLRSTQSRVNKSRVNKNKEYSSNSSEMKLAGRLRDLISKNDQGFKSPTDMNLWADDINKIIRLDGRSEELVLQVIEFSQSSDFWKSNILSPGKLRGKFTTLKLQMERDVKGTISQGIPGNRPTGAFSDLG